MLKLYVTYVIMKLSYARIKLTYPLLCSDYSSFYKNAHTALRPLFEMNYRGDISIAE